MSLTIIKIASKIKLTEKEKAKEQIRTALALGKKGIASF